MREDADTIIDNFTIQHSDLLGKLSSTQITNTSKDGLRSLRVTARHPTLDEFTSLAPRRVAPIYATYASTIVSLLDIHAEPPTPENDPSTTDRQPLQILEAGTGHGSLTLHLSRAIAAANPPVTKDIKPVPSTKRIFRAGEESDDEVENAESESLTAWRAQRRAVVHTIDIDPLNRRHADQLIRSYRSAIYWPHIDFHVGNVKDWIAARSSECGQDPFLDIVVLDMPGVEEYIAAATPAVKEHGSLLVFVPQITQIAACVQEIAARNLGLRLEQVVELGDGVSTGRWWDVRMATLRNARTSKHVVSTTEGQAAEGAILEGTAEAPSPAVGTIPPMVCRPIVGQMTRGGGFVGLWKRVGHTREP